MIEILFPVSFSIIAIVTKKDAAIIVSIANWLAVFLFGSIETAESIIVCMAVINLAVSVVAASGYRTYRRLSASIMILSMIGTILLIPLYLLCWWSGYALLAVQLATAMALIFFDGRRRIVSDMANDCRDILRVARGAQNRVNDYRR